jgi:hypothetical protein
LTSAQCSGSGNFKSAIDLPRGGKIGSTFIQALEFRNWQLLFELEILQTEHSLNQNSLNQNSLNQTMLAKTFEQ